MNEYKDLFHFSYEILFNWNLIGIFRVYLFQVVWHTDGINYYFILFEK